MTAVTLPLRFQVGARTLASIPRQLVRVPLDLDDAIGGRLPLLPPLERDAQGYLVTSLPEEREVAMAFAGDGMIAFVRQRYTRYYIDLSIGHAAYVEGLSANTRGGIKRKAKKLAVAVRRHARCPALPHPRRDGRVPRHRAGDFSADLSGETARRGPADDAAFMQRMYALAAADAVRGWLLYVAGVAVAYLYCPIHAGTVIYQYLGHDPAYNDLSPGGVLQMEAMRDLFADRTALRFDFTEGEGQHKRQFSTGGVACLDLLLLRPTLANRYDDAGAGSVRRGDGAGETRGCAFRAWEFGEARAAGMTKKSPSPSGAGLK